ncbi:hypothetical protein [Levilactobacillus acidifarinae]|uniref:Minor tail protein n=1 Tax=Levilactobacillus acidifarinae DSM 19394 = JCM 15949 TaxID=1423715 RepID=A0A0R1LF14_9LACO|nr:hypothetical protein [Levilactobacillus acidifarinae]KRK94253.1 minor tail protein [Levilactobacillus acidifarinae DSM 19394]GEO70544.1 hypothetical protein LAC03_24540 [Levilactobacillus acidifarinae]
MDLETLQVLFDINTANIQPKLDELQEKFSGIVGKLKGESDKASDSMSVDKGIDKIAEQVKGLNEKMSSAMNQFKEIIDSGSGTAAKTMAGNVGRMKTTTVKSVDAMMSEIDSKMEQARAAQERMMNLKSLGSSALSAGDPKQASRINEQAASAEARMHRFQTQARQLAGQLKSEMAAIPGAMDRIAHKMDENEGNIESMRRKIKGLEVAEKDAMKYDMSKGFNSEATIATDASRRIGDEISKLKAKMQRAIDTSDALGDQYGRLADREKALKSSTAHVDTELGEQSAKTRTLRQSFSELSSRISSVTGRMRTLMTTLGRVTGISRVTAGLRSMGSQARKLLGPIGQIGTRGASSMNKFSRGTKKARSSLSELKEGMRSLPAQFLVWGVGFEAITKFSQGLLNAAKTNRQFAASLAQIKANLMTAFYPLYSTIMPWLNEFMQMLAKATGWLANFSAALFGMSNATARAGAAGLHKQTKAMGASSTATSQATKAIQQHNAAIQAHNKAMQAAVQKENAAIQARNAAGRKAVQAENAQIKARNDAKRKALQQENAQIREANAKRRAAVQAENEKIKQSNAAAAAAVKKQNDAQKKQIADLKKKYQEYKNSLMGFDEINTLDVSKDIPDYTPKTAKKEALKTFKATPTKSTSDLDLEKTKTFTPEQTKAAPTAEATEPTSDAANMPDDVDNAFGQPMAAYGGAIAAAKEFKKILGELFKPMKEAWAKEGKGVIDAFKYALKEIERLLGDIGRSFIKVWDSKTGVRLITDILRLLKQVLLIIGDIAKAFAEAWEDHGAGTKMIRAILNALDSVLKVLIEIGKSFREAWNDGTGERIAAHLLKLFTDIAKLVSGLANSFRKAWTEGDTGTKLFSAWLKAFDKIVKFADTLVVSFKRAWEQADYGTKIFNNILKVITDIGKTIGNLAGQLDKAWKSGKTGQGIFHTILGIVKDVTGDIKDMAGATAEWAKKLDFRPLLQSIQTLFKSIRGLNKTVWDALDWGYKNVLLPLAKFTITNALPAFFKLLAAVIKVVNSVLKALAPLAKSLFNAFLKPFAGYTGGKGIGTLQLITKALDGLSNWIDKHQHAVRVFAGILASLFAFKIGTKKISEGVTWLAKVNEKLDFMKMKGPILQQLFNKITGLGKLKEAWSTLKDMTSGLSWGKFKEGAASAKSLAATPWTKLKDGTKAAGGLISVGWGKLKTGATNVLNLVKGFKSWSIWSKAAAVAQGALNAVMAINPYVLLAAAIAALVAGFVLLYKHNKKFRTFVNNIYKAVTKWLGSAINWIKKNWGKIAEFIINPVGTIATWFLKDTKTGKAITKWGKKRLKDAVNWAKGIGKGINEKVEAGKKWAKQAGEKVGKWVNGFRTKASKTIKTWAGKLGSKVHDGVSGAKKLATAAGTKIGGWVNGFRKKASSTIKKWAKGLGSVIHTGIAGAKSLATRAGTKLGGWVNGFRKKASSTLKKWSKGLGSTIHKGVDGAKSLVKKAGTKLGTWIQAFKSPTAKKIASWAGSLGGKIAGGLKKGVGAIKSAAASIANAIVGTIGKAVNGVITGLKWILNHVGAGGMAGGLSYWSVPHFAQGGRHRGGPAMVNDSLGGAYQESYQLPNGQQGIFPAVRNLMVNLPAGTKIKSASDTLRSIPHYKGGIGSFNFKMPKIDIPSFKMPKMDFDLGGIGKSISSGVSSAISYVAGIIGSVWDDVKNPLQVIKSVAERYVGFGNLSGAGLSIAKGGVDMTERGAVDTIEKALKAFADKVTKKQKKSNSSGSSSMGDLFGGFDFSSLYHLFDGFRDGGFTSKEGLYNLAEGNTPEVVLPLSQPQRAMKLMGQAYQYMHANFAGGITMPKAMAVPDTQLPETNGTGDMRGDGMSGMQQAIVNAVMMGMSNPSATATTSNDQQPVEVIVKLGDETLATHVIKGISAVNRKNGKNMLNL